MCNFVQFANSVTKFWIDCGSQCSGAYDDDCGLVMIMQRICCYAAYSDIPKGKAKVTSRFPIPVRMFWMRLSCQIKKEHKRQAYKLLYLRTNTHVLKE